MAEPGPRMRGLSSNAQVLDAKKTQAAAMDPHSLLLCVGGFEGDAG